MNLLLLPIPDEILLEYLNPYDMTSLAKTNKMIYKTLKPLIFKAIKHFAFLTGGNITKQLLNFKFSNSGLFRYCGFTPLSTNGSYFPRLYFRTDVKYFNEVIDGPIKCFIETFLSYINLMNPGDSFKPYGLHALNSDKTLSFDGSGGVSTYCSPTTYRVRIFCHKATPPNLICSFMFINGDEKLSIYEDYFIASTYFLIQKHGPVIKI